MTLCFFLQALGSCIRKLSSSPIHDLYYHLSQVVSRIHATLIFILIFFVFQRGPCAPSHTRDLRPIHFTAAPFVHVHQNPPLPGRRSNYFFGFLWCFTIFLLVLHRELHPHGSKQRCTINAGSSDYICIKRLAPNSIIVGYHVILILSPSISAA
jgi:hypothetical protein